MSIEPRFLFPTVTWNCKFQNVEKLNQELLDICFKLRKEEPDNELRSVEVGGWQSKQNIHELIELKNFLNVFNNLYKAISKEILEDDDFELRLDTTWFNINPPLGSNKMHIHPGGAFSGVYVIQKPKDSGNLILYDPKVQQFPLREPRNKTRRDRIELDMQEGEIIIFPAWLQHSVTVNRSKEERVTMSFNLCWHFKQKIIKE